MDGLDFVMADEKTRHGSLVMGHAAITPDTTRLTPDA